MLTESITVKKSLRRRLAESAVDRLPTDARRVLLDKLIQDFGPDQILRDLALQLDVTSCRFGGALGAFEGDIRDTGVLFDYARRKRWAPRGLSTIMQFFEGRSGTYVDIGANIGLTTIPVARNPGVRCECFEPEPNNLRFLRANLEFLGPFPNVRTHQIAVFDRHDELEFELSSLNMGDHRLRRTASTGEYHEEARTTVRVKAAPLDDVARNAVLPLAIKIDVQGAEAGVFAGGRDVLSQAEIIVFEFWPYGLKRMGLGIVPIVTCLRENFRYGSILEAEAEPVHQEMPIDDVVRILEDSYATEAGLAHVDVIVRQ